MSGPTQIEETRDDTGTAPVEIAQLVLQNPDTGEDETFARVTAKNRVRLDGSGSMSVSLAFVVEGEETGSDWRGLMQALIRRHDRMVGLLRAERARNRELSLRLIQAGGDPR
ncbi:MAG: hypothetical protein V9F04_04550 [Dermatophilaceae bacterium]